MKPIQKIAIVGEGFAGWYTAVSLQYNVPHVELVIIDNQDHQPVDINEVTGFDATEHFGRLIGVTNPTELFKQTGAIYKFGTSAINFYQDNHEVSWGKFPNLKVQSLKNFFLPWDEHDFYEPWNCQPGDVGVLLAWLTINRNTGKTYDDYQQEVADQNYFVTNPCVPVVDRQLFLPQKNSYGYQIDANQTVQFLKNLVYTRDHSRITHLKNKVINVNKENNSITSLLLEDGTEVTADLFIDASGMNRILMSTGVNNSWVSAGEDYNNSAWVFPSAYTNPHMELTGSTNFYGEDHGWRFKVNLYHRMANGYIFNKNFVDPEIVKEDFLRVAGETKLKDPKLIQWTPGHYAEPWQGNVIPVGIARWFIDPWNTSTFDLHSKSLENLINLIKNWDLIDDPKEHFNKLQTLDANKRKLCLDINFGFSKRGGPFWDRCRQVSRNNATLDKLRDLVLEKQTDLKEQANWFWIDMYILVTLATEVDTSMWDLPELRYEEKKMAEAYFSYTKERNFYISRYIWPNYYEWLREKFFNNKESHEMLVVLNPGLVE